MQDNGVETGRGEVQGAALRCHRSGQGIPTLVVGSDVYYPRVFSAQLRQHLQPVCVDYRGFAAPTGPQDSAACDLDAFAGDLE